MVFRNQISITADSGVGSTTTAKQLHLLLGISPWRWVNAGAIMRIFAHQLGLSIEEFAEYNSAHLEEKYDEQCDTMIQHFGEQDYVIFEGRLVHYFAPHAFHVKLICNPSIRAVRRAKDMPELKMEQILEKIVSRDAMNVKRYRKLYGDEVVWGDHAFNLVLDTGVLAPQQIAEKIIDGHIHWLAGEAGLK